MTSSSREIYIHIGPHKTASTAIQGFLKTHAPFLKKNKFVYPRLFWINNGHHELLHLFRTKDRVAVSEGVQKLKNIQSNVILSSECIANVSEGDLLVLRNELANENIKIVFFFRTPTERLYSLWQETIKRGDYHSFEYFYRLSLEKGCSRGDLNSLLVLDKFSNVFGKDNIRIVDYDNGKKVGVIKVFLSACGIKFNRDDGDVKNQSLESVDIEILRHLNYIYYHRGGSQHLICYKALNNFKSKAAVNFFALLAYKLCAQKVTHQSSKIEHVLGCSKLDHEIVNILRTDWSSNMVNKVAERTQSKAITTFTSDVKIMPFRFKVLYSLLKLP